MEEHKAYLYQQDKDLDKKAKEVLKLLKNKDERIFKAELEFISDAHSGDFRDMVEYEDLTPKQIVKEIIKDFKENIIIVNKTTPEIKDYDFEKENYKKCPVCDKVINYHIDGFYHDEILNVWVCDNHKLKEILKKVSLKDKDTIEFIKAWELDKQIVYIQ